VNVALAYSEAAPLLPNRLAIVKEMLEIATARSSMLRGDVEAEDIVID
jgi:hypothetical protein